MNIITKTLVVYLSTYAALLIGFGIVYGLPLLVMAITPLNVLSAAIAAMFLLGWMSGVATHQQKIQNDIEIASQTWSDFRKEMAQKGK